eukprot:7388621-Prymnesium_polylepis.2
MCVQCKYFALRVVCRQGPEALQARCNLSVMARAAATHSGTHDTNNIWVAQQRDRPIQRPRRAALGVEHTVVEAAAAAEYRSV